MQWQPPERAQLCCPRDAKHLFVASHIEMRGWEVWRKYPWNWDHDGRGQRLGRQGLWFGHRSKSKGEHVRATLETAPDKRPCNEAQAVFLRTMRQNASLTKEQFDMRWVSTGIRVSVNGAPPRCLAVPFPVASITIGEILKVLPREPNVDALQTRVDDA